MIPGLSTDAHVRLSGRDQVTKARDETRQACVNLGHALGEFHHAGVIADEEAVCVRCQARVFILYGMSSLQPLAGMRRYGTALAGPCRPIVRRA